MMGYMLYLLMFAATIHLGALTLDRVGDTMAALHGQAEQMVQQIEHQNLGGAPADRPEREHERLEQAAEGMLTLWSKEDTP
ncbi:hypothetical protein [Arhodomonas sp. SL1]|uniref:hypothetical protein n=1 Tax=Arhodomonas sp. SL1 TaxID=3425691 RepID=UPI003F882894